MTERSKKPHAAATGRVIVGGLSAAAGFGLVAVMAVNAPPATTTAGDQVDTGVGAVTPAQPAPTTTAPEQVIIRRRLVPAPSTSGSGTRTAPSSRSATPGSASSGSTSSGSATAPSASAAQPATVTPSQVSPPVTRAPAPTRSRAS